MAAKDARVDGDASKVLYECADLWFHSLVMLAQFDLTPQRCAERTGAPRRHVRASRKRPAASWTIASVKSSANNGHQHQTGDIRWITVFSARSHQGQIPSKSVYEDEDLIAFNDINPAAPVHVLIVPKQHIATLADCTESHAALLGKMMLLAPKLAQAMGCGYEADGDGNGTGGFKTLFNTGPDGGQEVYHLHLHVIGGPRPWRGTDGKSAS